MTAGFQIFKTGFFTVEIIELSNHCKLENLAESIKVSETYNSLTKIVF